MVRRLDDGTVEQRLLFLVLDTQQKWQGGGIRTPPPPLFDHLSSPLFMICSSLVEFSSWRRSILFDFVEFFVFFRRI